MVGKDGILQAVARVKENIAAAAERSGRSLSDITLVGVTKTVGVAQIKTLLHAGVHHLGENRVQEFLPKYVELSGENPIWHFIGHLQRNKVKQVVDKVSLIHSIDSLELACEVNKRAEALNKRMDILLEINIANEPSKHGILPENAKEYAERMFALPNVNLRGLMCVAPFVENGEKNRSFFRKMRKISVDIADFLPYASCPLELSMGMSGDYTVAIEEGATIVRIGTALVGNGR
jgi:hypothetical protein